MSELKNQRVLVTGAAQGIGRRIAETLAEAGASVALADLQADRAQEVADLLVGAGHRAVSVPVDITDPRSATSAVASAAAGLGGIDALVNNAGLDAPRGSAWEISEEHWEEVIRIDLTGAWWCTKAIIPLLRRQRRGRIVFISSIAARMGDSVTSPAYAAAKAGLIGLTVSLSAQLESDGVLVNTITPGPTGDTGQPMSLERRREYESTHPLGTGGAQPIADGVRYLLGPGGDWLSGSVLNISGGQFRGL